MFTKEDLETIAAQLRASANASLARYPDGSPHTEKLLRIANNCDREANLIEPVVMMSGDQLADYTAFCDMRLLEVDRKEDRKRYLLQRDATALKRHNTALKYDYPETYARLK